MAWPGYGDRADIVALTNEIEARLQQVTQDAEDLVAEYQATDRKRTKRGTHNFGSVAVNTVVTQAITFDEPFDEAPTVIPGLGTGVTGTSTQMVWVTGVSLTGFTLAGKSATAAPLIGSWLATVD